MVLVFFLINDHKDNLYNQGKKNVIDMEFEPNEYAGFSYKKGQNPKMLLIAKSNASVKLLYPDGTSLSLNLASGDSYSIKEDKDVLISSDKPKVIDVFMDNEERKYLGTLESFYVF